MSTFPDMIYHSGGVPVMNALYSNPFGNVWFVDGDNGSSGNSGKKVNFAKDTISHAITAASAGDTIYVREKIPTATDATDPTAYSENLTIPFAKHHLSIIGTSNNPWNPFYTQVKASAAGYGVKIQACSTRIENLDFNKGSASTGMIFFSGDVNTTDMAWGSVISNCHIRNASSTANAGIKFYAGSYNTIHNCDFEACYTGIHIASGGTYPIRSLRIQDCRFKGNNDDAMGGTNIYGPGASNIIYELEILRCYFERLPTGKFIDLEGTTAKGIISDCHFGDADATVSTTGQDINVPATIFVTGCYDDSGTMVVSA